MTDEYRDFIKEYNRKHNVCPECGGRNGSITLVGYILNLDKKEEYKDLNRFTCNCGHQCTKHDLISKEDFLRKKRIEKLDKL